MDRVQIESGIEELIVRKKTMDNIKKAGLPLPPQPEQTMNGRDLFKEWDSMKKMYGGIANIPYNILGEFLDNWSGILAYSRWVEAVADMDLTTAREIRDTIRDQLYALQEGGREIRAATVATEPMYCEWEQKFLESQTMFSAVRGLREGYEFRLASISREITRRGSDLTDSRRTINRGNVI